MLTKNIHLGSAVTVLPTEDPVRVFQQYATLDNLSQGRGELTVGSGAYLEPYPLFGVDYANHQQVFTEKLGLLKLLTSQNPVSWNGTSRAPLNNAGIWPQPFGEKLDTWVATGGTLESSERAAKLGFNAIYSFLGNPPASNKHLLAHYREVAAAGGPQASALKIAVAGRGLIASNARAAKEALYPHWLNSVVQSAIERGRPKPDRELFDLQVGGDGPILAGDPNEVADRLAAMHSELGHDRHILHMDIGNVGHSIVMKSIELFGTKVLPQVSHL